MANETSLATLSPKTMSFNCFLKLITILTLFLIPKPAHSIPFVVFHGISDSCKNKGVTRFTSLLSNWSGSPGHCIEIGNGAWDSWTVPFLKQTVIACEKVKNMRELRDGYNITGFSQGNLVGRGVLEMCDGGPPVKNYVSLAGPHAGIAAVPLCGSALVCILVDFIIELAIYSDFVQEHLAPANYIKIPTHIDDYRKKCKFLPNVSNEIYKNATYKEQFSSLENLVLIMFEQDNILVPKETSWFGYFPDGAWEPILPTQEILCICVILTTAFTLSDDAEDWIGLRTLDEGGKVKFVKASGGHLKISLNEMKENILPYLVDGSNSAAQQGFIELPRLQPDFLELHA